MILSLVYVCKSATYYFDKQLPYYKVELKKIANNESYDVKKCMK